jgi:hypothetical protein
MPSAVETSFNSPDVGSGEKRTKQNKLEKV